MHFLKYRCSLHVYYQVQEDQSNFITRDFPRGNPPFGQFPWGNPPEKILGQFPRGNPPEKKVGQFPWGNPPEKYRISHILGYGGCFIIQLTQLQLMTRQFPLGNRLKNIVQSCHDAWGFFITWLTQLLKPWQKSNSGHGGSLSVIWYSCNPMTRLLKPPVFWLRGLLYHFIDTGTIP